MLKTCEKNPLVSQETDQPYRYDRVLHMRLQFARQSTTCLGLPEIVERELLSLHEGNIARYQLRPMEYENWKKSWQ
jgi:hypothetical protein